jgi:hypothetical protein
MKFAPSIAVSRWLLVGLLVGSGQLCGCFSPRQLAVNLEGKPLDPFAQTNVAATVLIFISNDCPIANRYAPEIRRLQEGFAKRGVSFWLVHADPEETALDIREHARQYGLTLPVLRDPEHNLVRLAHVEVTPSAALFTTGRTLVYHGRIDDRVADLGRERVEPSHRDLAEALEAVLAGRTVPAAVTQAIGCHIPAPH